MTASALGRWDPLRVDDVAALLEGCEARWWLSGGVAIDHWLGRTTRPHGDIDVSVAEADWPAAEAHLARTFEMLVASNGRLLRPSELGPGDPAHNRWARAHSGGPWRLQLNLEPVDEGSRWRYRRDRRLTRPLAKVVRTIGGVPTVNPGVQLLGKAEQPRPVDELDRAAVLSALDEHERRWLDHAIATAHPGSPWCVATGSGAAGDG
ncbi:MAG: amino acid transporter [Actinomycetota bacterium]|nr:amino acid transporter [Acidimicrobiia bacterium]MDQ3293583.1 amino acid transporter [Actinomycetota bacterium]